MERLGGEDTGVPTSIRKVVVSSFIGTTIEWYDYFIYGTAAALVLVPAYQTGISLRASPGPPLCISPTELEKDRSF
jgi:hypothetical protein